MLATEENLPNRRGTPRPVFPHHLRRGRRRSVAVGNTCACSRGPVCELISCRAALPSPQKGKERAAVIDGGRGRRLPSGHELSLSLTSSLRRICLCSTPRSLTLLNGPFQLRFAGQRPLTNPFKEGSMDFMAPRALSPPLNKVKSKALSIRQWAWGTLDAALFNPRDATIHYMPR